jgi:hypothetical protein
MNQYFDFVELCQRCFDTFKTRCEESEIAEEQAKEQRRPDEVLPDTGHYQLRPRQMYPIDELKNMSIDDGMSSSVCILLQ